MGAELSESKWAVGDLLSRDALFAGLPPDAPAKLAPLLRAARAHGQVRGSRLDGRWVDIGTPQRLHELDAALRTGGDSNG